MHIGFNKALSISSPDDGIEHNFDCSTGITKYCTQYGSRDSLLKNQI